MKRRGFLQGIAALAALAVAPSIAAPARSAEHQRFIEMMKTGRVANQIFYLDGPIIIDGVNDLIIECCIFEFSRGHKGYLVEITNSRNLVIQNCDFRTARPRSLFLNLDPLPKPLSAIYD